MLSDLVWNEIENAFVFGGDTEFDFAHNGLQSLEWMQYDSRQRPFIIGLRYDNDTVVFSWGWESSTLHDAMMWESRPEGGVPALIELIKQNIRRVAKFGQYELKRPLESAELAWAFARVVKDWPGYIASPVVSCLLEGQPVHELKYSLNNSGECMLSYGKTTAQLCKRGGLWAVEVTTGFSEPEVWYFSEEANPRIGDREYVHSSNLVEGLSRTLCGA